MEAKERWNKNAALYDIWNKPMELMGGRAWRKMLFSELPEGNILEIGVGTGVNIEYYPRVNRTYTGIDISPAMLSRARKRADKLGVQVDLKVMDAEYMDFPSDTFDAVIATCVFCSVPDPVQGLREVRRVLKDNGTALFLEHMRPEGKLLGKVFDMANRLSVPMMGVNVNRRTVENIKDTGFEIIEERLLFRDIFRFIKARPLPR